MIKYTTIGLVSGIIILIGSYYFFSNSLDMLSGTNITSGPMGIGTSTPKIDLSIIGLLGLYPKGTATTTCSVTIEGAMMYSTGTQGFYGCDGTTWNAL